MTDKEALSPAKTVCACGSKAMPGGCGVPSVCNRPTEPSLKETKRLPDPSTDMAMQRRPKLLLQIRVPSSAYLASVLLLPPTYTLSGELSRARIHSALGSTEAVDR